MSEQQDDASFLKRQYQAKFYDQCKPKSIFQKVLIFQKKLQSSKMSKKTLPNDHNISCANLQEEPFRFRPSTNYSSHRSRCDKPFNSLQKKTSHNHMASEFRIIVNNTKTGENHLEKVEAHELSQRAKYFSFRENYRNQNFSTQSKLSKIDLVNFLQERVNSSQGRKQRLPLFNRKLNSSTRQYRESNNKSKTLSKKVFIGGKDLGKAAQEYEKGCKTSDRKKEDSTINKQTISSFTQRKNIADKRTTRKGYKQPKILINGAIAKTQPKIIKNEQLVFFGLQLDPWKVDYDYY